ncbi:MAG: 2TM domain-containing protein [Spirochaetota bacterium]|nr:MAG: 2TM domain-containing protein [Spirochaetota bacterium]
MDEKQYSQAKKIAKQKVAFIRHFITYVIVLAVLAVINNLTSRGYQWWLWIALFWGIGVFINFLNAYLFRGGGLKSIEKQLIKKEMERMNNEK